MKYCIKITGNDLHLLRETLFKCAPKENAAFLLSGKRTNNDREDFIVRRIVEIPDSEFRIRNGYHLDISPRAINGIISLCEKNNLGLILCHSHPQPLMTDYSCSDNFGEQRIAKVFHSCLPGLPIASLLISDDEYRARYWLTDAKPYLINSIKIIGQYIKTVDLEKSKSPKNKSSGLYDRQVLAFGDAGQKKIAETKIGIVGVGGTGSCVAEQLVRLGVKDLVIIDKDYFEPSNLTRLYGSFRSNIPSRISKTFRCSKSTKVNIVKQHLFRINKDIKIQSIFGNVKNTNVCKILLDRDIIFSCTDDHWGRSIVNQIAYQYLIPVINIGVRIDSSNGQVTGGTGALHILRPGNPCLWCYHYLNAENITAESLSKEERTKRQKEGYVQGIKTAPSVISLTSTIASMAITMFLQLITDFMGTNGNISHLSYDVMSSAMHRCRATLEDGCICQKVKGRGDSQSLFTQ